MTGDMHGGEPASDTTEIPASTPSLRSRVVSGFTWSILTSVVIQLSRIVFAVALARFLTPGEYGIATMALVFSTLVTAFTDLSLGVGLVQRSTVTEEDRSTVFWTNIGIGVVIAAAGMTMAGPLAYFYREPDVKPLFMLLSLTFVIGPLGATHAALLHRDMNFRVISLRVGSSTILGGAVGVALAAAGAGPWALIIQQLYIATMSTLLLWVSIPWRPRLVYSRRSLRELGAFGGRLFGMRVFDYVRVNTERMVVGRYLGSAPLGAYSLAFNILLSPVFRFIIAMMDALFPAFSRLQADRQRMASAWLRVNRLIAVVFVPALLGLAVVASDFVSLVLGHKWQSVAPLLQILALGIIAQALSAVGLEVLKALGRVKTLFRFTVLETIAFLAGIVAGLPWGAPGVAAAYTFVNIPSRAYFLWLTTDALGVPFGHLLKSLSGVAQASLVMVACTLATKALLASAGALPPWLRLTIVIAVGVAVYVPICLWRVPEVRAELGRIRRDGLRRRDALAAA